MKTIKLALLLICLSGVACKDMLTEKPDDRLYSQDFYKSKEDVTAAVDAIYRPLYVEYGNRYGVIYTSIADYGSGTGFIATFVTYKNALTGTTDPEFQSFYQSIRMANIALKYIPASSVSAADKSSLMGEASFLRALCYRNLVRGWGGVPLRTEPTESLDDTGGKRAPVADVYAQIIKDLQFAEANLPATQALAGKPTKWAAKLMLADIYLQTDKWAEARDKADEVIVSNAYSLVPVTTATDFEKVFGAAIPTSTEDVFSVKMSRLVLNTYCQFFHPSASTLINAGFGSIYPWPTSTLVKNWDKNDLRSQFNIYTSYTDKTTGKVVQNAAATPIRYAKFKDPGFAPYGGSDVPIYRYAEALLIYAEAASQAAGGPTALALQRLNMVHRRAYGFTPTAVSAVDFTLATAPTGAAFRDLVLKERAYEFFCEEGHRWFDMVRTGTVKSLVKAEKNIDVPDFFLLFPIPAAEIDNNPDIGPGDQNPGY